VDLSAHPALLIPIGLVGGLFGGMLGLGGGWLFGPALSIFGLPATHAVGTSIAAMAAQASMSAYKYHKRGRLRVRIGLSFGVFATLGMESGRQILRWLTALGVADMTLRSLYVGALILIGLSVWPRGVQPKKAAETLGMHARDRMPTRAARLPGPRTELYEGQTIAWLALALIGFVVGNLSGILGIGGGTVMVPLLAALYRMPMALSVPTSLLSILCASSYGVVVNLTTDTIQGAYAGYLVAGALTGGNIGASLAIHADELLLKRLFAFLAWLTAGSVALRLFELKMPAFWSLIGGSATLAMLAVMLVHRQKAARAARPVA
jgi:uncharacterized membrane protein YfcA